MKNKKTLGILAAMTALTGSALADVNAGVSEVTSSIGLLKADMGTVVTAGVGFALVGLGALAAYALIRRFMGK